MRSRSDLAGATPTAAGGAFAVLAVAGALLRHSWRVLRRALELCVCVCCVLCVTFQ